MILPYLHTRSSRACPIVSAKTAEQVFISISVDRRSAASDAGESMAPRTFGGRRRLRTVRRPSGRRATAAGRSCCLASLSTSTTATTALAGTGRMHPAIEQRGLLEAIAPVQPHTGGQRACPIRSSGRRGASQTPRRGLKMMMTGPSSEPFISSMAEVSLRSPTDQCAGRGLDGISEDRLMWQAWLVVFS